MEPPTPSHCLTLCTEPEGLPGEDAVGGALASLLGPSGSPPPTPEMSSLLPQGADQGMVGAALDRPGGGLHAGYVRMGDPAVRGEWEGYVC